ncbi:MULTISPECIES: hypothetical protein [Nocardia]|uniref:hypothetical protein n=1 Tax=Nocardia TaxID=1817 RepID=UPI001357231A|nr:MULTISPECIES: hypothetical protein [Nocardia]
MPTEFSILIVFLFARLSGGDVDLAAIVLDVARGVGVIRLHLHDQLGRQIDQLGVARDPRVSRLLPVITHGFGEAVAGLVGCVSHPFQLLRPLRGVEANRRTPFAVLLFLGLARLAEGANRLRQSASHRSPFNPSKC